MNDLRVDGIYSIDLPSGPPQLPKDPANCWVVIQADIGITGEIGTDSFTFYFTTHTWLDKRQDLTITRNMIIHDRFNWDAISREIEMRCNAAQGSSWEKKAKDLAGEWEFE